MLPQMLSAPDRLLSCVAFGGNQRQERDSHQPAPAVVPRRGDDRRAGNADDDDDNLRE